MTHTNEETIVREETAVKKKRRRRRKNHLLNLLIVAALGVGAYYWLSSPMFDVQKIVVENNHHYTKGQIISMAEAQTGQNIFSTDTGAMKALLLEDPYIKNARVKRSLTDTIVIQVGERKEAACVPYANQFIIIDGEGLVLRKSDIEPRLPLLVGMTIKTMEDGKPLEVEETATLTGALGILDTMENADYYFKKIDISNVVAKVYIYDQLVCQGIPEHILESMRNGNLKRVLSDLYTNGIERGIISVGRSDYFSFDPMTE